jgi:DnaA-homolog protein
MDLVCLDDIDSIAGLAAWEEQIFHLYNRIVGAKTQLLVTASVAPTQSGIRLPDLRSRLAACMVFQLHELTDKEKIQALQLHSKYLGIALPDLVGNFILSHYPRDMYALFELLDKLVKHALQAQKRLTIPMAKALLARQSQ